MSNQVKNHIRRGDVKDILVATKYKHTVHGVVVVVFVYIQYLNVC